jgi:hypothetical protein
MGIIGGSYLQEYNTIPLCDLPADGCSDYPFGMEKNQIFRLALVRPLKKDILLLERHSRGNENPTFNSMLFRYIPRYYRVVVPAAGGIMP